MRSKSPIISGFIRLAWVMLALFLVVFCGPVKKLIEQRFHAAATTSSPSFDKKLRTWYREKRDITPLVQTATHQAPDTGFPLFIVTSLFFSLLLLQKFFYSKVKHAPGVNFTGLPIYLRVRKLQV